MIIRRRRERAKQPDEDSMRGRRAASAKAVPVVAAVIRDWDPYDLLALGGPIDEFDREIASVAAQLPRVTSPADAAHLISRVFSSAFSDAERFSLAHCTEVGQQLYAALVESGIIGLDET